jgi:hypothetical protein
MDAGRVHPEPARTPKPSDELRLVSDEGAIPMFKMILATVALAAPVALSALPATAAVNPNWNELQGAAATARTPLINQNTVDFGGLRNAQPGGYLAVLTEAQTNRLDRACSVVIGGGYSAGTVEFCRLLKDEIDSAEANEADSSSN